MEPPSGFLESAKHLCLISASLDLDEAFDPDQFNGLPPLRDSGTTPWTKYLRTILKFTTDEIQCGMETCRLCPFLRAISKTAGWYKVPSVGLAGLGLTPLPNTVLDDGDGFTLAAISSHFIYPVSDPDTDEVGGSRPPEGAAVWLIVIKGSNTLERLAHEYQSRLDFKPAKSPQVLIGHIVSVVRNTGVWIAEVDTSDLSHPPLSIRGRLVTPDRLDYNLMKSWLTSCAAHPSCRPRPPVTIPHMKLIDCSTLTIVSAVPPMPYLALSYVWGSGPPETYIYPHLPTNLPQTVRDAIQVTLSLGFRHLWVDRYCIWQDDPAHKSSQILAMRDIYGHAAATLAAASGSGPDHGLPGASSKRSRTPRQQIVGSSGQHIFVSAGSLQQRQDVAVSESVWDTRAWTFQEATLSRRIFFFTDVEVSFWCAESQGFEHLSRLLKFAYPNGAKATSRYGVREPDGVVTLVRRYSKRKMTYSSDAMNACVGALGRWTELNDGCFHYWGIPIIFKGPRGRMVGERLWLGLCWRLEFHQRNSGERREGFPTWSWLAVDGKIECITSWTSEERSGNTFSFAVEDSRGTVQWEEFVERGGLLKPPHEWGRKLRIEGWVFDVGPFVGVAHTKPQKRTLYYAKFTDELTKKTRVFRFLPDFGVAAPARLLFDSFEAISTYRYDPFSSKEIDLAIVFEKANGLAKRIGLLLLAEREVVEGDIPIANNAASVDLQTLGARWGAVWLD